MRNWNFQKPQNRPTLQLPDYLWGIETLMPCNRHKFYQASRLPMRNWNSADTILREGGKASRLPMRNWNSPGLILCIRVTDASRLPMRNWNSRITTIWKWGLCFQTTYEELKQTSPLVSLKKISLPDYLWGIETTIEYIIQKQEPASRLPMRNWNFSNHLSHQISPSFQTTYEELKHCALAGGPAQFSFQTTYEELKPTSRGRSSERSSFQTTYEELKPVLDERGDLVYFASRLPMRNWNVKLYRSTA